MPVLVNVSEVALKFVEMSKTEKRRLVSGLEENLQLFSGFVTGQSTVA